jgi:D-amino-acid dehydrogenase
VKVLVIGGGAVGLCCAHALAKRGADVTLLERDRCGGAASAGNAGWVTPGLSAPVPAPGVMRQALRWMRDSDSPLLVRPRADLAFLSWSWQFARACRPGPYARGTAATFRLATSAEDCFDALADDGVDFEMHADGLLYLVHSVDGLEEWLGTYQALADLGFDGELTVLDRSAVRELEPAISDEVAAGLLAGRERHVRPESLVAGLVRALRDAGATLLEHRPVVRLARATRGWAVRTESEELVADRVVVAAGVWSREILEHVGVRLPLEAAKGYSITVASNGAAPRRPLYLTEAKVGVSPFDGRVRLAGTLELAGLDLSLNRRRMEAVARSAGRYLRDWPTDEGVGWAGLRPVAPDGVPIVGPVPGHDGLFVATGHAMLGITLAPSTGEVLAPAVLDGRIDPALAGLGLERFSRARGRERTQPTRAADATAALVKGRSS